jgi:hypothetical protein
VLDDLLESQPDGTERIATGSTMGLPFCGALLMAAAAALVLIVGSVGTLTRIGLAICLAFFLVCAFVLGSAMLNERHLIRWGSWGLAVYNGRRVAWSAVRSMRVVTVFGREYLAIWLDEPDASDPAVAPRMRRLRMIEREGHMTIPGPMVDGQLQELLVRLETARRNATADTRDGV